MTPNEIVKKVVDATITRFEDMFSLVETQVGVNERDDFRVFLTAAIMQALEERDMALGNTLEAKKRNKKTWHTPNCLEGTDKYNHDFCEISGEDEGFNDGLETAISIITNPTTTV